MSNKSGKKKTRRADGSNKKGSEKTKRTLVTDAEGWTHVVRGPRHDQSTSSLIDSFHNLDITSSTIVPIEDTARRQHKYDKQWRKSQACVDLDRILHHDIPASDHLATKITRIVCLGLGSLTHGRESSRHQFATLTWLLDTFLTRPSRPQSSARPEDSTLTDPDSLEKPKEIEIILQDPIFTPSDETFFSSHGYTVLSTPTAYPRIDASTLLFAPHLERGIYAAALQNASEMPAICIGCEVAPFLEQSPKNSRGSEKEAEVERREREIFQRFNDMMDSIAMPEYTNDTWCLFTRLYWKRDQ